MSELKQNYSSEVVIELIIGKRSFPVSRTGPGYVVLKTGADISRGEKGILRILIDDREHLKDVILSEGAVPFELTVDTKQV